jgi:hypothetical protein
MSNKNSNWKWNLLAIATAVAATAATASAQEKTLRATVPFAFSINRSATLPSGNYIVEHHGHIWRFRSEQTNRGVMVVNYVAVEGKNSEKPSLTFECLRSSCQVSAIHVGPGEFGAEVLMPKLSKSDAEELAVVNIPLQPSQGE